MVLALRNVLKGDDGQQFLVVLRNASIMSIIFGLLFSECLGFELPWAPIIYSRHLNIGGGEAGAVTNDPGAPDSDGLDRYFAHYAWPELWV